MITDITMLAMPLAATVEEAKDYVNGLDTLWVCLGAYVTGFFSFSMWKTQNHKFSIKNKR